MNAGFTCPTQSDPASVIRIAIALAALKHKPRDQSTASYLLDLQSHFPLNNQAVTTGEWRTYALELERQLTALKAQRDADQESFSRLRADASQAAPTSDAPPKKKSKKNSNKDRQELEWNWDQSRADWSNFLQSQHPPSPSLVAAYTSLKGALASLSADHLPRLTDAILRALETMHVFLFSPPSPDQQTQTFLIPPSQLKPEHIDSARIAMTSPLLMYVLRTALPSLLRAAQDNAKSKRPRQHTTPTPSHDAHTHVDSVLDHLLECILLPLLRALTPLCIARLAPLLAPKKTGRAGGKGKDKRAGTGVGRPASIDPPKQTDTRTDAFALLAASLEALDALQPFFFHAGAGGIRDRLGLETIRALEALYAVPPCPSSSSSPEPPRQTPTPATSQSQPQPRACSSGTLGAAPETETRTKRWERPAGTRAERVRALATRDAAWFLASTLNLCVAQAGARGVAQSAGRGESSTLLREALIDRIGRLVRSVDIDGAGELKSSDNGDAENWAANVSKLAVDPVCQNMLLAICERAMTELSPF